MSFIFPGDIKVLGLCSFRIRGLESKVRVMLNVVVIFIGIVGLVGGTGATLLKILGISIGTSAEPGDGE